MPNQHVAIARAPGDLDPATAALEELARPIIIGRSSSHFTRVTRIFAAELRVEYSFQVVPDLMSSEPGDYGGNPALRLPTLQTSRGVWFGALNICRELWRQSSHRPRTVWPEDEFCQNFALRASTKVTCYRFDT